MTASLLQLSMRGKQNKYIDCKPKINLFKTLYKQHSPFAIHTIEQYFNSVEFGNVSVCNLLKDPDLLLNTMIKIELPTLNIKRMIKCSKDIDMTCFCSKCNTSDVVFGWANSIGHLLLDEFSFNIGSQTINKKTGEWLEIWTELAQTAEKKMGYWEMIGKREPASFKPSTFSDTLELYIPLDFYFNGKPEFAFPICTVEDNISITIKWRNFNDCWISSDPNERPAFIPSFKASLITDYAFIDTDSRKRIMGNNHLYLIEQVQKNNPIYFPKNTLMPVIDLNYSQLVKTVYWIVSRADVNVKSKDKNDLDFTYGNDWFNFSCFKSRHKNIIQDPFIDGNLILNGEDRTSPLSSKYYRLVQSYYYHTKPPSNYIYTYSFALRPEDAQPTGACNMSPYNTIKLKLRMCKNYPSDYNIISYCLSLNWLIIKEHKASLAFSL